MINIIIFLTLLIVCNSPAFPQGSSFSGTRGNSLNGRISPGGQFSATDEDGNFVNGYVSPGGHLQATDSNGNFINGNISPSGFFSGTDSNGNFLNGKVRNQDDDILNTGPLGNDASRNSIYPTDAIEFRPEDKLDKALRAVQILDTLDSMDRRDQQAAFQQSQMQIDRDRLEFSKEAEKAQNERFLKAQELDTSRLKLDQITSDLNLRNEAAGVRRETDKKLAALSIAEVVGAYDPYDARSRSEMDKAKALAVASGYTSAEVGEMFKTAEIKTVAAENLISNWKDQSGVDWVEVNGRRDIEATRNAHEQRMRLQKEQETTWTANDFSALDVAVKSGMRPVDAKRLVTAGAAARNIYRELVENNLYDAPDPKAFDEKFVQSLKGVDQTGTPSGNPLFNPVIFNSEAFFNDPDIIKATKNLARLKQGEIPNFKFKETQGLDGKTIKSSEREQKNGVYEVESWAPDPKKTKEAADAAAAVSNATISKERASLSDNYKTRMQIEKNTYYPGAPSSRDTSNDSSFGK
jgi:hypothetical protein